MAQAHSNRLAHAEFLRPAHAAALLGVGRTSFWRLRKRKDFPAPKKFAGALRFRRADLLDWADAQELEGNE